MKLIKKVMLMCALLLTTGCAIKTINEPSACIGWMPIYLGQKDLTNISSNLARDILKHNKQGEGLCGWKHG
nr:hypothetical protein [Bartonella sp. MM73XJBT.G]